MKRLILNALAGLLLTTQAFANSNSLIQTAVDTYLYSTEVEGKSASDAARDFQVQMQASGLSQKEQLQGILYNMKDQELKSALTDVLASVDAQKLSAEETHKMMMDAVKGHSSRGASWNGNVELVGWGIMLLILLTWMALADDGGEQVCAETAYGEYLDVRGDKYFWVTGEHCVRWEDKQ